ncbi:hypothetical protein BDR26DRAFT_858288 [Obelidium mucronatum]|nr:hypothetical protein BDR26DRAFT_858288 [Obelidium mucronatum]
MPRDIEGLIASQVFSSRIQQLNDSLKEFKDCKDRGPLMRLLTLILVFSVNLAVQLLSDSLMCILVTFCISLVFMVIVSEAAMARHKFEKEITTQLIGFNQEDEAIRLVWRLVPYGNLVFISLRPIPFARLIQIQHVMKGGANEEEEYLPAYSRLAASLEGGLAELPSYDTLA